MQEVKGYTEQCAPVNRPQGPRSRSLGTQRHSCKVRVGAYYVRVTGDFQLVMGWVYLALAEMPTRGAV